MKTYCKTIDPSDTATIEVFIWRCIEPKLRRKDYSEFVARYAAISAKEIRKLRQAGLRTYEELDAAVKGIARDIRGRIIRRELDLDPVRYEQRTDGLSRKTRIIGIESVLQQIMEHVAVGCLEELWAAKYEYHQYASIKGKGQLKGARAILKWTRSGKTKYWVKLDARQCFRNLKREVCMAQLGRDIGKNERLLWFVDALLRYHGDGLIIGSLLSQFLCNYVMSYAYRYVLGLYKTRRGKRIKLVARALFYMDDILLTGGDRRNLLMAVRKLIRFMGERYGLALKPGWNIREHARVSIDMMGYVVTATARLKVRRRVFLRGRRAFVRAAKSGMSPLRICRRVSAYFGFFKAAKIKTLRTREGIFVGVHAVQRKASTIISAMDKGVLLCAA